MAARNSASSSSQREDDGPVRSSTSVFKYERAGRPGYSSIHLSALSSGMEARSKSRALSVDGRASQWKDGSGIERASSSSSHRSAVSDAEILDEIVDQCIVGGKANLSFTVISIPLVSTDSTHSGSVFRQRIISEALFVRDIVRHRILPRLKTSPEVSA